MPASGRRSRSSSTPYRPKKLRPTGRGGAIPYYDRRMSISSHPWVELGLSALLTLIGIAITTSAVLALASEMEGAHPLDCLLEPLPRDACGHLCSPSARGSGGGATARYQASDIPSLRSSSRCDGRHSGLEGQSDSASEKAARGNKRRGRRIYAGVSHISL